MAGTTYHIGSVTTDDGKVVDLPVPVDQLGNAQAGLGTTVAGERAPTSVTGLDYKAVSEEWTLSSAINVNSTTTVFNGPCLLRGFFVETTIAVAAITITDNATTRMTLPIGYAVNEHLLPPTIFRNSLRVTTGAGSTGSIRLWYRPLPTNVTWA